MNLEKQEKRGIRRAVEGSNPRHQVLETCVLPTELTAQQLMPPPGSNILALPSDVSVKPLLHAGCFAHTLAQVKQLRTAHLAPAPHFHGCGLG